MKNLKLLILAGMLSSNAYTMKKHAKSSAKSCSGYASWMVYTSFGLSALWLVNVALTGVYGSVRKGGIIKLTQNSKDSPDYTGKETTETKDRAIKFLASLFGANELVVNNNTTFAS